MKPCLACTHDFVVLAVTMTYCYECSRNFMIMTLYHLNTIYLITIEPNKLSLRCVFILFSFGSSDKNQNLCCFVSVVTVTSPNCLCVFAC